MGFPFTSIHTLYVESDFFDVENLEDLTDFNPHSLCREWRKRLDKSSRGSDTSIHTLYVESDNNSRYGKKSA